MLTTDTDNNKHPAPGSGKTGTGRNIVLAVFTLLLSLGFALVLGEGVTRLVFHGSMDFDMEMWKYASSVKLLNEQSDSVYGHDPGAEAVLMGVPVRINSHGLRGEETTLDKPSSTYRVLAVGDSITMGWGVSLEDTYPRKLEQLLNEDPPGGFPGDVRYEVLNLGVGNYNTTQELSRLQELGLKFDPDLILLGYFINDAEPTPAPTTGLLVENSYLLAFLKSRLRLLNLGESKSFSYKDYYSSLYGDEQPGWISTQNSLRAFARIQQSENIPVAMFIIPELHDLSENYPFAEIHDRLIDIVSDAGMPAVDLYPIFKNRTPEEALWVSSTDAHHNAEAQALIARGIYDALDDGLISQPRPTN